MRRKGGRRLEVREWKISCKGWLDQGRLGVERMREIPMRSLHRW